MWCSQFSFLTVLENVIKNIAILKRCPELEKKMILKLWSNILSSAIIWLIDAYIFFNSPDHYKTLFLKQNLNNVKYENICHWNTAIKHKKKNTENSGIKIRRLSYE